MLRSCRLWHLGAAIARDIGLMVGQRRNRVGDLPTQHLQQPVEFVVAQLGRDRVIASRLDPLPQHNLHPAILGEQFIVAAKDAPGLDRTSVVAGQSSSVWVYLGGREIIKKKTELI